jgi:hypothetical protein
MACAAAGVGRCGGVGTGRAALTDVAFSLRAHSGESGTDGPARRLDGWKRLCQLASTAAGSTW